MRKIKISKSFSGNLLRNLKKKPNRILKNLLYTLLRSKIVEIMIRCYNILLMVSKSDKSVIRFPVQIIVEGDINPTNAVTLIILPDEE